ncbi:hypothetical protein ACFVYV_09430 [Streptomyces mirabilis]|uniref:hypothetical protein n=1 Tax=Streptomyces mirabilis TaxID=68239 RepID=UPI0036DDB07D
MEPIKVTAETVLKTLREVVAERPEHVYESPDNAPKSNVSCYYVHGYADGVQVPGCVVGHVLNRLGVPLSELRLHEGESAYTLVGKLLRVLDPEDQYEVEAVLSEVQYNQDGGQPWGRALEIATRE